MLERRRSERVTPGHEIYARIKSSIPVRIVDVSQHGMRVESSSALPPSGECDIWLPADDGDVMMRIRVQRCRARFVQSEDGPRGLVYQAGVEFLEMDEEARAALLAIVAKLEEAEDSGGRVATTVERDATGDSDEQHGVPKAV
jgi:hypothetical protein